MNESSFVERREQDWKRLTHLCDKAEYTPTALSDEELSEFIRSYRNVSADLATIRTKSTNIELADFLNDLVGRAYGVLYRNRRRSLVEVLKDSVANAAQTARRRRWFVLASAAMFVGSGIFTYVLMGVRPDIRESLHVSGEESLFSQWKSGKMPERSGGESILYSAFYASHNPTTAIISGAIAASTFGVGTAYMVMQNGQIIGMLSYEMMTVGKLGYLYYSILPHGVPELSGLVMSGAAGLCMGWALIVPGRRRRADALKEAGKDAIVLLSTSIALMFIAAPIEGFFSFNPKIHYSVKIAVILIEAVVWTMFWTSYGREDEGPDKSPRFRAGDQLNKSPTSNVAAL